MEEREYPRIHLPFEVEISHPAIGRMRSVARDVSEGGIFVAVANVSLKVGSKVKVTVLNDALVENTPTPTVDTQVARVEPNGIGLKFVNRTSTHLWQSVTRLRDELRIGQDYFQVFQGALVVDETSKLLVVQQHGKWLFPGDYLMVGGHWQEALTSFLGRELGLTKLTFEETLGIDSPDTAAPENATLSVFHRFSTATVRVKQSKNSRYKLSKWIGRHHELDELTFSHPLLRKLGEDALTQAEKLAEAVPASAPRRSL